MILDLDEIEARAKAATPGPWEIDEGAVKTEWQDQEHPWKGRYIIADYMCPADGQYIAAMSPDVALALVSRIRELEAEVARLRNERDILAASIDWAGAGGLAAVDGALDKLMDSAREYLAEKEKAR